jgi:hypothetical protein
MKRGHLGTLVEKIKGEYKREFLFWAFSVILSLFMLFFFLVEIKTYFALKMSKERIEEAYVRIQPQIVRIKEVLAKIDWQRNFKKESFVIDTSIDLRNLQGAYKTLKEFSSPQRDIYLLFKEMKYDEKSGSYPVLQINGEVIIFR